MGNSLNTTFVQKIFEKFNYEIIPTTKDDLEKGLQIIKKDKLLKKNYDVFIKTGKSTNKFLKDPTKPENWGTVSSTNLKEKFTDTNDYKKYIKYMKIINEEYTRLKKKWRIMKSKRLHDHIYLKENRYKKTKEMFKFIDRHAFKNKKLKRKFAI